MTAIAARRRRRTWSALGAGVLVVAAVPVLGIAGWHAIRDSRTARDVTSTAQTIPLTPTALVGGVDGDGQLSTLAMLALAPDGAGGSLVSIPVGSSVMGEDGTRHRLADGFAQGGIDQLRAEVESMMLVTIDLAQVVDEAQLAALLAPVGDVSVDLPNDVVEAAPPPPTMVATVPETTTTAPRRSTTTTEAPTTTPAPTLPPGEVIAPAGPQQLAPDVVARALLASVPGESETNRLPANKAIWTAVAAAVGEGRPGLTPVSSGPDGPADVTVLATNLWAGTVRVWQLGVTPITSSIDNPTGADLLQTDLAETIMVVASVAPSAISAVLDGASVQLTSGFADWQITRQAVAVLVYIGANVMVVVNTDTPPPATSEVLAGSAAVQPLADEYSKALHGDAVGAVTEPVEGVDVQIVLGESFADNVADTYTPLESVPAQNTIDQNMASTSTSTSTTVET